MKKTLLSVFMLSLLAAGSFLTPTQGQAQSTARGVLLYQPFCEQCPEVLEGFLYPLSEEYGGRLELLPVDVSEPEGARLLASAVANFGLGPPDPDIPLLILGDQALSGKTQIVDRFRALVDAELAAGNGAWPELDGLGALVEAETTVPEPAADPVGEILAWVVMVLMLAALGFVFRRLRSLVPAVLQRGLDTRVPLVPWLALAGVAISIYLFYVKLTGSEVACGPVGDCNLVQSSPYASILGVPMSLLGLIFYLGILSLWAGGVFGRGALRRRGGLLLVAAAVFGTLFSVYLTSLELFVIHAVCAWCLTSAVLTTIIMLMVVRGAGRTPRVEGW